MDTMPLVLNKLSKRYPGADTLALDDVSLSVNTGEVYGFLGANGAGKSTTIRLLLNFLQPTSGSATIMGLDIVKSSVDVKRHVGYLSGDVALYPKVTGQELLDYLLALQGGADKKYLGELTKRFEAELDKPIGALSKGNRQKIGVIQALMHQPDVLILDEPTSGLDPLMQEVFYEALREAKNKGVAVLMSSHNLDEAQRVCDRVGIIKHGKLIREQAIGGDASLSAPMFRVSFRTHDALVAAKREPALRLQKQVDSNTLTMQPKGTIAEALAALSKYDIVSLFSEQTTLEDEFIEFYGGKSL
ncbi:MAG: ABC transporter ATP-binding protein [Candidatus Saccharimonadales bacterium]